MEANLKELQELIFTSATKKLCIPKFQRPYKWENQQIDEFWDDIVQDQPSLFIGPVIINGQHSAGNQGWLEVVDGQQRLITSTILAAAIRDIFIDLGENGLANIVQDRYIAFVDDDGNDLGYRLTPGLSTKSFFEQNIQNSQSNIEDSTPTTKEEKRIYNNYKLLRKKLLVKLDPETTVEKKKKTLSKIRDTLKLLKVIEIKINNDNEAYEIFERINNYGVDLSLSDLLKNHILKNSSDPNSSHTKWYNLEKTIRDTDTEMKKFVRYHWLSQYSFKSEKQLYVSIKQDVLNCDSFLDELCYSGEIFSDLLTSTSVNDFDDLYVNNKPVGKYIFSTANASKYMSVTQDKVFYLCLVNLCKKNKLMVNPKKILSYLESFIFKYFAVSNLPANKVERMFSKYSVELHKICYSNDPVSNIKQNTDRLFNNFQTELNNLLPTKDYFVEKFQEIKYSNSSKNRMLIKYVLDKYELCLSSSPETVVNFNSVNLEHFLPQKPENWNLTIADVKGYVHNIGNLVLVDQSLNGQMGNKPLSEKLLIIDNSVLNMNRELIQIVDNNNAWDKNTIEERNKTIANILFSNV
jgi:uncharacterized protein with ParB-like and HNH nuclease domain